MPVDTTQLEAAAAEYTTVAESADAFINRLADLLDEANAAEGAANARITDITAGMRANAARISTAILQNTPQEVPPTT